MSLHRYPDVEYVISKPFLVSCHQYGHWAAKGGRRACVCARGAPRWHQQLCQQQRDALNLYLE